MRRHRFFEIALTASTAVAILFASLRTGWFGDDASYANLRYAVDTGRVTVASAALASYTSWLTTNGRWYPGLVLEKYAAFAVLQDRIAYKAFLIAVSLVALAAAWRLLAKLFGAPFASLSVLATIACFQIRGYHDPFIAYNGMIQVVAICLFLSLAEFATHVESGKRRNLVASLVLYVASCSIYEISYLWAPLYAVVAYRRADVRRSLTLAAPVFALGFAFVVAAFVLRLHARVDPSSPYAVRLDAGAYAAALADQIAAALPLSYLLLNPSKIFLPFWHGFGFRPDLVTFAIAAACAYVVIPPSFAPMDARSRNVAIALALLLLVVPACELPLLLKYQTELKPGLGYLPVFIEYFGTGVLLALVVAGRVRSPVRRGIAVLGFAVVASLSAAANEKLADILDAPYLASRAGFERALAHGLLANVPDGATLAIAPSFPWVCDDGACIDDLRTSDMVASLAHKRVVVTGLNRASFTASLDAGSQTWTVSRRAP